MVSPPAYHAAHGREHGNVRPLRGRASGSTDEILLCFLSHQVVRRTAQRRDLDAPASGSSGPRAADLLSPWVQQQVSTGQPGLDPEMVLEIVPQAGRDTASPEGRAPAASGDVPLRGDVLEPGAEPGLLLAQVQGRRELPAPLRVRLTDSVEGALRHVAGDDRRDQSGERQPLCLGGLEQAPVGLLEQVTLHATATDRLSWCLVSHVDSTIAHQGRRALGNSQVAGYGRGAHGVSRPGWPHDRHPGDVTTLWTTAHRYARRRTAHAPRGLG